MTGRRVVVGISHSSAGLAAIRHAVGEARHRRTTLHTVRVWPYPPTTRSRSFQQWEIHHSTTAPRYVRDAFDMALGGIPPDLVTVTVPYGRPAAELKRDTPNRLGRHSQHRRG